HLSSTPFPHLQHLHFCSVTTRYRPPGLSPGPGTPTLPKPPPRPPWARTATQPTPPAITGHHCLSTPPATATCGIPGHHRRDRHISAGSQLSHHISAGTTRHPWPTPRPPSHIM
ncbi:hypothetical protein C0993_006018, partial [Termitomyces sp. T159_Od127]